MNGDGGLSLESVLESVVRITEQRSRENLEHCLVTTLIELTEFDRVGIARPLVRGEETLVECLAMAERGRGLVAQPACTGVDENPAIAEALATGRMAVAPPSGPGAGAITCLPITDHQGSVSAFLLFEGPEGEAYRPLLSGFAAVYRNFLGILRDAERDTLTGLKNRKTFDDNINRVIAQSRTVELPPQGDRRSHVAGEHHWLAIFDIDHFKRINDTYGHVFGDEVLLLFATLMRKVFRAEDLLFRFGGEEFVVVLAPTTADHAARAFERFRETIEGFNFPQVGKVTVSIGFVRIDPADIPSTVVGQADEALYWAKKHGRNQVCWYDDLVARGELQAHATTDDVELF